MQSNNFIFFHHLSHWQGFKQPPTGWFQFEFNQVPVKCLPLPLKDCSCCSNRHPCSDKNNTAKVGCCFWDGHLVPDGHSGAATARFNSLHVLLRFVTRSWHVAPGSDSLNASRSIDFQYSAISSSPPASPFTAPTAVPSSALPGNFFPSGFASQQCPCKWLFRLPWLLNSTTLPRAFLSYYMARV